MAFQKQDPPGTFCNISKEFEFNILSLYFIAKIEVLLSY